MKRPSTMPMDVFRFCPRCGSNFSVQDDRSFLCGGCGLHYFINANAAVCALIVDLQDRLLLTLRAQDPGRGMLDLPGGFVTPLETAEDALKRELREELNLTIDSLRYFGSYPNHYLFSGLTIFTLDLAFVCKAKDISGLKPADDVADAFFIPLAQVDLGKIAFESIRTVIDAYRRCR
ncbi:MAG: NUDIX domain-containing protein [Syntrophaceae bacterium]